MRLYARLLAMQLRLSLTLAMQYRVDFIGASLLSLGNYAVALVPFIVVFGNHRTIAGWSWQEALVVFGWFVMLRAVLEGAITPSLTAVVDHIRKGTLDFVILKPADAQFLVSTARFLPQRVTDFLGGVTIVVVAFHELHRWPEPRHVAAAVAMLFVALAVLYSLWILVISVAFIAVRVDNLSFLFSSIFDAARWPSSVFRGALGFVFTFVIPLAVMTTTPAQALLGTLSVEGTATSLAGAALFSVVARRIWLGAIRKYTSAGG